jgi:hypothetical protein
MKMGGAAVVSARVLVKVYDISDRSMQSRKAAC